MELAHGRANKAEHNVQVVNHQVQHHVDVQGAAMENAESVCFEEHRPMDQRLGRDDRGVEALQHAHLKNPPGRCRLTDQGIRLRQSPRDGFFQQNIESLGQSLGGNGVMRGGGNADGNRVQMQSSCAAGLQASFRRGKERDVAGQRRGRRRIISATAARCTPDCSSSR